MQSISSKSRIFHHLVHFIQIQLFHHLVHFIQIQNFPPFRTFHPNPVIPPFIIRIKLISNSQNEATTFNFHRLVYIFHIPLSSSFIHFYCEALSNLITWSLYGANNFYFSVNVLQTSVVRIRPRPFYVFNGDAAGDRSELQDSRQISQSE